MPEIENITKSPSEKRIQIGRINPSQLFLFLFFVIILMIIFFMIILPKFYQPSIVYRREAQVSSYPLDNYQEDITSIYSDSDPVSKYNKLRTLRTKVIKDKGYLSEDLMDFEQNIKENFITEIRTVKELTLNNPLKYFPEFEKLIEVYEQIPSIIIDESLNNIKTGYIQTLKSGERETIAEYRKKYYFSFDSFFNGGEIKELANTLIKYIETRIKIAKETKDSIWAYNIIKETLSPQYYGTLEFSKFPKLETIFKRLISEAKSLREKYRILSAESELEIEQVNNIFNNETLNLNDKLNKLEEKSKEAQNIDKSLRLKREILRVQMKLVEKYYKNLQKTIIDIISNYKIKSEYNNILNNNTITKMKAEFKTYLENIYAIRFPYESKISQVKTANDYLKLISKNNINFIVTLNSISSSVELENLNIEIGTYNTNKEYKGEFIKSHYSTPRKNYSTKSDNIYFYEYNKEIIFPFNPGEQIIIRIKSGSNYIFSISSNERTNFPLTYSLPNERGNHFLIFKQTSAIPFKWKGNEYEIKMSFNTTNLPKYPDLFIKLFK